MKRYRFCLTAVIVLFTAFTSFGAEIERTISNQRWTEDLHQLAMSVKDIHFKPFHVLSEDDFDAAVVRLESGLADMSEPQIMVEMVKIIAMLGDGHTRLHIPRMYPELALRAELGHSGTPPPKHDALKFGQAPVQFQLFSDGLFVIGALPQHRQLIGQRVLAFDKTPVEKAIDKVRDVSFFENDSRARLMAPDRLALPEVLKVLGVTKSERQMKLRTVDNAGKESTTTLRTIDEPDENFISGLPAELPLWLGRRDEWRWYQILPDRDAMYVQINEFEEEPVTPYGDFVAETIEAARAAGVSRFVIDLRHNFGGIGSWVTPFVTGLGNSEFNEYGRLYVLVGRTTFSAAQHFMHRFEEYTYAMFIGEHSGARPSHYGDSRRIVLKNSGLTLRVSTIYWHSWLANDFRDAINPHVSASISSADYFEGTDPVLDAALNYKVPETLAEQIEEQFRQDKNQNALLHYQRYMSDARFSNHKTVVPDLLAMADRLIEDGLVKPGYFIYFVVNRSYPGDPAIESELARIRTLLP